MCKLAPFDVAADIRQMGEDDFYDDRPQSYGLRCWGPGTLALKRWLEGWEQAEVEAYCDTVAEKDQ